MSKAEYIELVNEADVKEERKKEICSIYHHELCDELVKVISVADTVDFFDEERRALSYREIVNASELLGIDVVTKGMIPVIDAYDCTFIVFLLNEKKWAKYNTIDKEVFKEKEKLEDII